MSGKVNTEERNQGNRSSGGGPAGARSNKGPKWSKDKTKSGFKKKSPANKEKFKGKCKELEGFIFDANRYNQADEYIRTVREIAEYVGTNYDHGSDVRQAIEEGVRPTFMKPVKPAPPDGEDDIDETDEMIWKKEVDYYVKRVTTLEANLQNAFSLVWGQCSDVIR